MDAEERRICEIQADLIGMFANARRIMIIDVLSDQEKSVGEIAAELGFSIQNVSQHLRVMKDRGVLVSRKVGQTVYYRTTNPKFSLACKLVRAAIAEELVKKDNLLGNLKNTTLFDEQPEAV